VILKEGAGKFLVLILGVLITIVKVDAGKFFLLILGVLITVVKVDNKVVIIIGQVSKMASGCM
jgi:hypothetical protein